MIRPVACVFALLALVPVAAAAAPTDGRGAFCSQAWSSLPADSPLKQMPLNNFMNRCSSPCQGSGAGLAGGSETFCNVRWSDMLKGGQANGLSHTQFMNSCTNLCKPNPTGRALSQTASVVGSPPVVVGAVVIGGAVGVATSLHGSKSPASP